MPLSYGDVYFVPQKYNSKYGGHYIVLLAVNTIRKKVYFQALSSRMYKVFPSFGTFRNVFCKFCSIDNKFPDFKKQLDGNYIPLDIDEVVFLNFRKYSFLSKETFLPLKKIEKDNLFDFENRVKNNNYKYLGNLTKPNCQSSLIAVRQSSKLNLVEISEISNFFKKTFSISS